MKGAWAGALLCAVLWAIPAVAQTVPPPEGAPAFLKPDDVVTYRAIFADQDRGRLSKADALIKKVHNKALMGYVLEQRYLGRYYITKFSELSAWLSKYAGLSGADRIYRLALRKKPKAAARPTHPTQPHWRGGDFDDESIADTPVESHRGRIYYRRMQHYAQEDKPERAEKLLHELKPASSLPQADLGRLGAYVAAAYLADDKDADARRVAESVIAGSPANAAICHWTAGLASYRMGRFADAAHHFEAMSRETDNKRNIAAGAFWAARSYMRAGTPDDVIQLYARAADQGNTFYAMIAARILGRDVGFDFTEPALDPASFAKLMDDAAARRAVSLWQVGQKDAVAGELARAFGEISPDLDPAFAALARALGAPSMELRAAETSTQRDIYLTSLYPIPTYTPKGGYRIDPAVVLAIARQESRFVPDAQSSAGARGLMQIMPATAVHIAGDPSLAHRNKTRLDDPVFSLTLAQRYLTELLNRQNGNLLGLAAAYNAGAGNLDRWLATKDDTNDPLLFIESVPVPETRDYIKRVMMNFWMYRKRLGEPVHELDETAAGNWPTYSATTDSVAAADSNADSTTLASAGTVTTAQ